MEESNVKIGESTFSLDFEKRFQEKRNKEKKLSQLLDRALEKADEILEKK